MTPREQLLARKATAPAARCTPVPCPDCPVDGVFVARMTGDRLLEYYEAVRPFEKGERDTPEQAAEKARQKLAVQLRFAAVDERGAALFRPEDDIRDLDAAASRAIVGLFFEENGFVEKKSPPPNGPSAG